jgi:O-antigen/teichoic acid export membrane protein
MYLRSNITALQLFRTDSLISVLDRTIMIALCSVLLFTDFFRLRFTIEWFVYAQTAGYFLTTLITFAIVLKKSGKISVRFNPRFFLVFLRKSYPYALLILLMALYNRIDSVMLERLLPGKTGHEQAGIYAQAFRLLDAVSMFGVLVAGLLLPIFSKMIKQREPVGEMVKLSFTLLIVPAVIIAVSSVYYDGEIMSLLYKSNTAYSSDILGVLMIGFIGIATTYIFGTLLTANGSLKQLNIMAFSGMVLNVVLNLILIPRFYAYGSAYASLSTQIFTGITQLVIALVIFKLKPGFKYILQILVFTAFAIALAIFTKNLDNWIYGYLTTIAGSVLFAFIIRLFSIRDMLKIILYK